MCRLLPLTDRLPPRGLRQIHRCGPAFATLPMLRRPLASAALRCGVVALIALAGACLGPAGAARAQSAPLTQVDAETQVRVIRFRFVDTQTFPDVRLKEHIWHGERGRLVGLRRALGVLPFVPAVGEHPFHPLELARDAVRIERFYGRRGFLFANVDWLVSLDAERNLVDILFVVNEGPPLRLERLAYVGPDGAPVREHLAPELRPLWERFTRRAALREGERLDEVRLIELEEQALSWTRDHGYPFSRVRAELAVDTLAVTARVSVVVDPGPRATIGEIFVEGNEHVPDRVLLRELPFRPGEVFSQHRLVRGQRDLFGLNLIRMALVEVAPQPPSEVVDIRVRVREHDLHALTAQIGYLTDAGLIGNLEWMHRNFIGGARTFTASVLANTGWLATVREPDRRYRFNLNIHQPYAFSRHFAATAAGFAELRDFPDRSRAFGGESTLLYDRGPVRNASTSFEFEDRRLLQLPVDTLVVDWVQRGGPPRLVRDPEPPIGSVTFDLASEAARLDPDVSRSQIHLRGTFGEVDNPLDPRRGFVLRPSLQATVPFPYTRLDYRRVRLAASGYLPLTPALRVVGRASVGHLFPGGPAPTTAEEAFMHLLRLRDAVFLAGGTVDVRGWGPGQLGPKLVEILPAVDPETDLPTFTARRYFPIGGTTRATASAELRYDITRTFGLLGFADAGRVWTPQAAWQLPDDNPLFDAAYGSTERVFVGIGGGLAISSPVGAIQVSLGYKVNPSFFDVRDPNEVAGVLGRTLIEDPAATHEQLMRAVMEQVEPSPWRRLRLHVSIGQLF